MEKVTIDINNNTVYQPPPLIPFKKKVKPMVCYPTIYDLDKNLAPPGHTPAGSTTDLPASSIPDESDEKGGLMSDRSISSSPSITNTTSDYHSEVVEIVEKTPVIKPVLVISKSEPQGKTLQIKDTNSNLIELAEHVSSGGFSKTSPSPIAPGPLPSEEVDSESQQVEIWENVGKTCTHIVAPRRKPRFSATIKKPRRPYKTCSDTESGDGKTSTALSTGSATSSIGTSGIWSVGPGAPRESNCSYPYDSSSLALQSETEQYPPKYQHMFGSLPARERRNIRQTYPHLKSVLQELKDKEVVFDRFAAIQSLKARVLRGDRVTHEEIKAIRHMTLPPHQRHLGWRLPWSKDLCCIKGLVHIPTPNKPAPEKNTFGSIEELRLPSDQITAEHWGRRQYVVNLTGFQDDDISLYLEGKNRLVIRAVRPDGREKLPPTTVTETIVLPPDLPADNLRIVRKASGTTIIEESWRF